MKMHILRKLKAIKSKKKKFFKNDMLINYFSGSSQYTSKLTKIQLTHSVAFDDPSPLSKNVESVTIFEHINWFRVKMCEKVSY